MTVRVSDIISIIEETAPLSLSEDWDNSGLQVGSRDWETRKVVLALDPTEAVVEYACFQKADMLITHHPLIFKALKSVDFSSPVGRIIKMALENRLAIYSAHTNFDKAGKGINQALAARLNLKEVAVLCKPEVAKKCKLVFFVPTEQKNMMLRELFKTTAGIIGDYTCCSFLNSGSGTYKPGTTSKPFKGESGRLESVDEVRIESVVDRKDIDIVLEHLKAHHPYETMAYDIYPLEDKEIAAGLGRVGTLPAPLSLDEFAKKVKQELKADMVRTAGNKEKEIRRVALCTGSGSSLLSHFFASGADVYLSGDLHYHDALMVEEKGLALVDAGHFATEISVAKSLESILKKRCEELGFQVELDVCTIEKDPFTLI